MYQVISKHLKLVYLLNFKNIGISDFCQQMFKEMTDMMQTPLVNPARRLKPINSRIRIMTLKRSDSVVTGNV